MAPSSLTLAFDAIASSTLFNWSKTIVDQISTGNPAFYAIKKAGGYVTVSDIGERPAFPLMYEVGSFDSYSGYDPLDVTPMDGITTAFGAWRQASTPIAISGLERKQNSGEEKIISLLETKSKQALLGIQEGFAKAFLRGAGGSSITTAYTSPANGSSFVDPLPLLVKYDPTSSTSVLNINQATYSWWQNQATNSSGSTFAAILKEMEHLFNLCAMGPGGSPNLFLCDQNVYELYTSILWAKYQNNNYRVADFPFENQAFHGKPMTFDQFIPDAAGGSATQSTTSGTLYMLNTDFIQIKAHSGTDFTTTPMVTPNDQDASTAHILWLGASGVTQRRKQGVMGSIDTTVTS